MAGDDWARHKIDELKASSDNAIAIGPFGSRMKADLYMSAGVPVIRGNNISDTRALIGDFVFVSEEIADQLKSSNVFAGDLIFPHRGAIGEVGIVPRDGAPRYLLSTSLMKLSCNEEVVDPVFLFYFFRSAGGRHELLKNASTVGTPGIATPLTSLRSIEVMLPPRREQSAIAHILGTLDDKIELNRRMNETLEAMARALFQSWFVDFDPVHAKAEGRDTALPKDIADLFPDRFEDSELSEIPEGWRVGRLDEVLVLQRGFDLPTLERTPGPYPVIAASGPNGTHNQFMVRGPGVTTGRSGILGNVFYIHEDFWPLNTSLWVKQFKHSTPSYAYNLLRGLDFASFNAGSAVPTLNRNHVHNLPVIIPPIDIIQAFEDLVVPLLKRQKANADESHTLAAIRDALLPKLISGELRVTDAERFLAEAQA
jgi:type I restriction enzyme, S subunit